MEGYPSPLKKKHRSTNSPPEDLDSGDADDDVAVDANDGSDTAAETSDDIRFSNDNDAPLSAKAMARAETKTKQTRRARAAALKRSKQPVKLGSAFLHYVRDTTFDTE